MEFKENKINNTQIIEKLEKSKIYYENLLKMSRVDLENNEKIIKQNNEEMFKICTSITNSNFKVVPTNDIRKLNKQIKLMNEKNKNIKESVDYYKMKFVEVCEQLKNI